MFQVDERVAPDGHPDRNLNAIVRHLVEPLGPRAPRLHPMPVAEPLAGSAHRYAAELEATCGSPPLLDVVHLGLGADGHTASLVVGDAALGATDGSVAVTGAYEGRRRLTLTLDVLRSARRIVFLVTGADKAAAVAGALAGDEAVPAARLATSTATFFLDADAARASGDATG